MVISDPISLFGTCKVAIHERLFLPGFFLYNGANLGYGFVASIPDFT